MIIFKTTSKEYAKYLLGPGSKMPHNLACCVSGRYITFWEYRTDKLKSLADWCGFVAYLTTVMLIFSTSLVLVFKSGLNSKDAFHLFLSL